MEHETENGGSGESEVRRGPEAPERPQAPQSGGVPRLAETFRRALTGGEHIIERGGDALWRSFKKRPVVGVGVAALSGLGLAALVGASDLVVAVAAGVGAYKVLKKHEPPSVALEEAAHFGL